MSLKNDLSIINKGKIFKTDKGFYKGGITNQKQCYEYEDVECIEGLVKLEEISNDYNNIDYFNGNYKNSKKYTYIHHIN